VKKFTQISLKKMKRSLFFILLTHIIFTCCTNKSNNALNSVGKKSSDSTELSSIHRISKEIAVLDSFFQITNLSSACIDYRQGPFSIIAEGDSSTLSHITPEFDGGILTLRTPMDSNGNFQSYSYESDAVIHVSCPILKAVALCSGGGFRSEGLIRSDDFQLGGLVGGSISIDSLDCNKFRYESSGSTTLDIRNLECDESIVISTGTGVLSMNVKARSSAYFDIKGSSSISSEIYSPKVDNYIETDGTVSYTLDTDYFEMFAQMGTVNLRGHATQQKIDKSAQVVLNNDLH